MAFSDIRWHRRRCPFFVQVINWACHLTGIAGATLLCPAMKWHYNDVIMVAMASQTTSLTIVYWTVYSGADQIKHQSSVSLAFVRWIHRGPVNSPHKWPVTQQMFPFDDVIMKSLKLIWNLGTSRFHLRVPDTWIPVTWLKGAPV